MPELILPSAHVHASFLNAMDEFRAEGRGGLTDHSMIGHEIREYSDRWTDPVVFGDYVTWLRDQAREDAPRPPGLVACTTLWWASRQEFLGRLALRHHLTPRLLDYGGHIGYDIRPSARRRGHATAMLAEALPVAAKLGIDPVLVTCDDDNVGSRKVIEANGGVFEDQRREKLRYWVPTSAAS
jgi:predicted acetyltransferase